MFIIGIKVVFDRKYVQFDEICSLPQSIKRQDTKCWPPSAFPYLLILDETHLYEYLLLLYTVLKNNRLQNS